MVTITPAEAEAAGGRGDFGPLVALVRGGSERAKEQAAAALRNLAVNADNQVTIAAAGAIEPLVALVRGGSEGANAQAAAALWNLADNADNQVKIALAGGFWPMLMHSPILFLLFLLFPAHAVHDLGLLAVSYTHLTLPTKA